MPNRDYAVREKSKKGGNKLLIILIILLLLGISGLGLWFLQQTGSKEQPAMQNVQVSPQPKATLPSRPEETYSYIRDLETREVPVSKSSKYSQLTKEQEQQILKQQQLEKQKQEQQAQLVQTNQSAVTAENVPSEEELNKAKAEALAKKKELEKKQTEEKLRKQAELKKQQELAKKAEQSQAQEQAAPKVEQSKTPPQKIVATAKPASEAPKPSGGKYGLQCGAFKSKAQAENMQARLAMAGYNARISSSADWNRVFVGPVGDRAAASAAQSNARSVAECLIVGM